MASRKRDYKAEYAARNAKSQRDLGVSYGKQRRAIEKSDLNPNVVRDMLKSAKNVADDPIDYLNSVLDMADESDNEDLDIWYFFKAFSSLGAA